MRTNKKSTGIFEVVQMPQIFQSAQFWRNLSTETILM